MTEWTIPPAGGQPVKRRNELSNSLFTYGDETGRPPYPAGAPSPILRPM